MRPPRVHVFNENGNQVHSAAFDGHRASAVQTVADLIGQDLDMDTEVSYTTAQAALEIARTMDSYGR